MSSRHSNLLSNAILQKCFPVSSAQTQDTSPCYHIYRSCSTSTFQHHNKFQVVSFQHRLCLQHCEVLKQKSIIVYLKLQCCDLTQTSVPAKTVTFHLLHHLGGPGSNFPLTLSTGRPTLQPPIYLIIVGFIPQYPMIRYLWSTG